MTEPILEAVSSGHTGHASHAGHSGNASQAGQAGDRPAADLVLRGDLDHDSAEEFLDIFRTLLPGLRAAGDRVLIDCAHLRACDYSGLAALLMARRETAETGARLVLVRQSARLAALLSVAGVGDLLSATEARSLDGFGVGAIGLEDQDPDSVHVTVTRIGGVPVVALAGEVDLDSLDELTGAFVALHEAGPDGRGVIDLSRMEFADSTVLHLLLGARAATDLWLVGPLRPQVHLLFQVTDLLDAFRFTNDLGEAIGTKDRAL
ncbi:hypothetical protein GCM10009839_00610 [Catenulispora yoronensis]|uniref:STAS domain-containing protein n=1 Tax=Catenulispora yoronensis TaxID=450799 RepID=A0ABN2TK36_9ACTN